MMTKILRMLSLIVAFIFCITTINIERSCVQGSGLHKTSKQFSSE